MKMHIKRSLALVLSLCLLLALAACGDAKDVVSSDPVSTESAPVETDSGTPVRGGSLTAYQNGFHSEFDPSCATDRNYVSMYSDYLWNLDWSVDRSEFSFSSGYINSNYLVGQLAESWVVAEDYSSISVKIRGNVYFQDKSTVGIDEEYDIYNGRQLTASDVKYSYDRLLGYNGVPKVSMELTSWPEDLIALDSVEVVDEFNLIFHLNTNNQLAVDNFMCAFVGICGPEWDELTDLQKADWHYAAGSGPFILTNYVMDNSMTFVANPGYWDTDEGGNQLPYLDEVILVNITDFTTALSSFISGDLDMVISSNQIFDPDLQVQLASSLPEDSYVTYSFSNYGSSVALKQGGMDEPIMDVRVRKAMQYAIDLDAISNYLGYSYDSMDAALSGIFAVGTDWNEIESWDEELLDSYTTYDPELAKELLAEAGYENGFEINLHAWAIMYSDAFALAAEYLKEVGITMNVIVESDIVGMVSIAENPNAAGITPALPSTGLFNTNIASACASIRSDGTSNVIFQNNAEIDSLVDQLATAETLDSQIEIAKTLDQTFMDQHYFLYLSYNSQVQNFVRSYVKGFSGEKMNENYYPGFVYARLWTEE